jgi:hypothetical protein
VQSVSITTKSCEFETRSFWGVFDTTLCDQVWQWLATSRWFSPGTLVSSIYKIYNWNIVESGVKHHKPTNQKPLYIVNNRIVGNNKRWDILCVPIVSNTPQNERVSNSQLLVVIGTDCTGSYKSNYYTITATTARLRLKVDPDRCLESDITLARHKHRWGKFGLLLSYQIRSFVVQ